MIITHLPIIVSYYTVDTPYQVLADRLRRSCEQLTLDYHIIGVPSRGSWLGNTAMKAAFCLETWRHLDRPMLWVDADAIMRASPDLLRDAEDDFAVHKWKGQYFSSGTVFFNQTSVAERLLEAWCARCRDIQTIDQVHLEDAWTAVGSVRTQWLPRSYYQIFDSPRIDGEAVIEHFQASRTHREYSA